MMQDEKSRYYGHLYDIYGTLPQSTLEEAFDCLVEYSELAVCGTAQPHALESVTRRLRILLDNPVWYSGEACRCADVPLYCELDIRYVFYLLKSKKFK